LRREVDKTKLNERIERECRAMERSSIYVLNLFVDKCRAGFCAAELDEKLPLLGVY
jgi:hypothetical protein